MSFKDKFKSIIGIDEEEYEEFEVDEEEEDEVEEKVSFEEPKVVKTEPVKPVLKTVTNNTPNNRIVNKEKGSVMPMNKEFSKTTLESNKNKVIIREPNEYSDAQDIADCLKDNFPVFINLQRLEKSQAKRVVDFLSGTIYAIDGDIKRVGTNLFLCTPRTIETEGQVSLQELQLEVGE